MFWTLFTFFLTAIQLWGLRDTCLCKFLLGEGGEHC